MAKNQATYRSEKRTRRQSKSLKRHKLIIGVGLLISFLVAGVYYYFNSNKQSSLAVRADDQTIDKVNDKAPAFPEPRFEFYTILPQQTGSRTEE